MMMKRFAFLLVCLLFSTTLIGMTRAQEGDQPKEGDNNPNPGDNANQGGETVNNTETANENNDETKTGTKTDEEPSKGNDETVTNAPEKDDTVTEAPTVPAVTEAKKDDEATTKGSAGSVLPNLLVVMATAVAGYNFAS